MIKLPTPNKHNGRGANSKDRKETQLQSQFAKKSSEKGSQPEIQKGFDHFLNSIDFNESCLKIRTQHPFGEDIKMEDTEEDSSTEDSDEIRRLAEEQAALARLRSSLRSRTCNSGSSLEDQSRGSMSK